MHELLTQLIARTSGAFSQHRVPHALVGGVALAVHGYLRATTDIDMLIDGSMLSEARRALESIGLLQAQNAVMKFKRVDILRALSPELGELVVVDVLIVNDLGSDVVAHARASDIHGVSVPVASADDIVLLKLLRDSVRDRADIEELAALQPLDRDYLTRRASDLGILDRLHRALPELSSSR